MDQEPAYQSAEMAKYLYDKGYRCEPGAPRDKHGMGIAERSVALVEDMANTVMMYSKCPQQFWSYAFQYAADTMSYNYHSALGTSPYTYITGNNAYFKALIVLQDAALIQPLLAKL